MDTRCVSLRPATLRCPSVASASDDGVELCTLLIVNTSHIHCLLCCLVLQSWLERYFILFEDGVLGYYTSDKMEVKQVRQPALMHASFASAWPCLLRLLGLFLRPLGIPAPRTLTHWPRLRPPHLTPPHDRCWILAQLFEKRGKLKVKGSKLQDFERGAVIQRDGYLFGLTSAAARALDFIAARSCGCSVPCLTVFSLSLPRADARLYIMEARTFEEREEWMNILVVRVHQPSRTCVALCACSVL